MKKGWKESATPLMPTSAQQPHHAMHPHTAPAHIHSGKMPLKYRLRHFWHKLSGSFIFVFLFSLIWLIYKTGTKPSRIVYPCQRAAAANVGMFVAFAPALYIAPARNFLREMFSIKNVNLKNAVIGFLIFGMLLAGVAFTEWYSTEQGITNATRMLEAEKLAGPTGLFLLGAPADTSISGENFATIPAAMALPSPHRVVTIRDASSTTWSGQSYPDAYANQNEINLMVDRGVMELTGAATPQAAWQTIIPYTAGQSVAIKLNFNNLLDCSYMNGNPYNGAMNPSPQVVNAVIRGLKSIGVPSNKIWITDPSRPINKPFRNYITDTGVLYYTTNKCASVPSENVYATGYVASTSTYAKQLNPSYGLSGTEFEYIRPAQVFADANYIINIPQLKGHGFDAVGHVSLGLKNNFGSVSFTQNAWGDDSLHNNAYFGQILADIYNSPAFYNKTRLTIGDGIMGNPTMNWYPPATWTSFGGQAPKMLFFGVDPIATDSVMFDYIHRETGGNDDRVANYGASLGLGVRDHWVSDTNRTYTAIDYKELNFASMPTNLPPSVSIISPSEGANYPVPPATVSITANAGDTDGTVTKVEFYNGATLLATDTNAPYSYSWTGVAEGSYTLTAKAYDDQNASTTSSPVHITVGTIINGACGTANGVTYPYAVSNFGSDTLCRIGAQSPSTVNFPTAGNPVTWQCLGTGTGHADASCSATHASLVDANMVAWWPLTDGVGITASDASTHGNTLTLNNSPTWISGGGLTFNGSNQYARAASVDLSGTSMATVVFWTDAASQQDVVELSDNYNSANSFMIRFGDTCGTNQWEVAMHGAGGYNASCFNPPSTAGMHLYAVVLDRSSAGGTATFYIDGNQVTGSQTHTAIVGGNFGALPINIMSRNGTSGSYSAGTVKDVRIYSRALTKSEIMAIYGSTPTNQPPTVSITAPIDGANYPTAPASVALKASAGDVDGAVTSVEFYNGATLLGTGTYNATDGNYNYAWNSVSAGNYTLTAKAYDNNGASTTSSAVHITVGTIVNGACGTANGRTYAYTDTNFGAYTFCSTLTQPSPTPTFPSAGNSVNWTCTGSGAGHTDASCSATHASAPGTCPSQSGKCWYVDSGLPSTGMHDGNSWNTAWRNVTDVTSSVHGGDIVYISGGASGSSQSYSVSSRWNPVLGVSGAPVTYQIGQDSQHNGTAVFNGSGDFLLGTAGMSNFSLIGDAGDGKRHFAANNYGGIYETWSEVHNFRIAYIDFGIITLGGDGINLSGNNTPRTNIEIDHLRMDVNKYSGGNGAQDVVFALSALAGTNYDDSRIHDNDITLTRNPGTSCALQYQGSADGYDFISTGGNGLSVYNNNVTSTVVPDSRSCQHQDGFQPLGGDWLKFYNNKFVNLGNTAIFLEAVGGNINHVRVYNNLMVTGGTGALSIWADPLNTDNLPNNYTHSDIIVANNLVYGGGDYGNAYTARESDGTTMSAVYFYNNIAVDSNTRPSAQFYVQDGAQMDATNIVLSTTQAASDFLTYTAGSLTNNFHLTSSATGLIGKGTNLSSNFTNDLDGNVRTVPWDIGPYIYGTCTGDCTPPSVSITSPSAGSVSGTVSINVNASDANGIQGVQFQVDGVNVGALDTVSPYSYSWDSASVANGSHTLTAIAYDNSANHNSAAASVAVTVANAVVLPTVQNGTVLNVSIDSPLDFNVIEAGNYRLEGYVVAGASNPGGQNSFCTQIDANPGSGAPCSGAGGDTNAWDLNFVTPTPNWAWQNVTLRGSAGVSAGCSDQNCAQYNPMTWVLSLGAHTLYENTREAGTQITQVRFTKVTSSGPVYHPADTGQNLDINSSEYALYANAWRTGAVNFNYFLNAANIWKGAGQTYHYTSDANCSLSDPSTCWVIGN